MDLKNHHSNRCLLLVGHYHGGDLAADDGSIEQW